jgi:hypothetical protein
MAGQYQWLSMSAAIQQLGQRLNITPSATTLWTPAELQIYITTALRMFNSLTWTWRTDFAFTSTSLWNSLGSIAGSPRQRTLYDTDAYTEMQYMLLEPPTGQVWTGTNQFGISVFSQALQRRRDEMLQIGNLNQVLSTAIPLTPGTIRTQLPDNTIDVERVRYLPLQATTTGTAASGANSITVGAVTGIANGQLVTGTGIPYPTIVTGVGSGSINLSQPTTGAVSGNLQFFTASTLYRDDTVAQEFYEAPLYQQPAGTPTTFSLSSEPPLSLQVDIPPSQVGNYEAVVLQSGAPFNPPTPTLLGIPDDLAWVLQWGALADLLGQESEATDRERSSYALKRYQDGLQLMLKSPWIELGKVNGQAVSLDSIYAMDRYSAEWDSNPNGFGPNIVVGGTDFLAAPVGSGIGVTVLGNAPILDSTGTYVQISRSDADIMFFLAQARAAWKQGGAEFQAALELEKQAIQACAAENSRLRSLGAFSDVLDQRGLQQERDVNRYNSANKGK